MKIGKRAQAGTLQSSDLMVLVEPANVLVVEIESTVKQQFEHLIRYTHEVVIPRIDDALREVAEERAQELTEQRRDERAGRAPTIGQGALQAAAG